MIAAVDALGRDDGRDHSEIANFSGAQCVIGNTAFSFRHTIGPD
jgi:hypothetical protein